jgi:cardiolipin synthase
MVTQVAESLASRLHVLLNGDQIFPAELEAIRSARRSVTYAEDSYADGTPSEHIAEALDERSRAGVDARGG